MVSKPIITYLRDEIFTCYGVPEVLVSDNGTQFKSKNSKIFCPNLGCRICCTVYSPQANARERMNRTLNVALRSYAREDHRQWDAYLPRVNCALRNTKHEARDKTPYQIVFRLQMITHSQDFKLLRKLQGWKNMT